MGIPRSSRLHDEGCVYACDKYERAAEGDSEDAAAYLSEGDSEDAAASSTKGNGCRGEGEASNV